MNDRKCSRWSKLIMLFALFGLDANTGYSQFVVVQQPTFGVSIDAEGVLRSKEFPGGVNLIRQRFLAAKARLGGDLFQESKLRCVSLKRLGQAIQKRLDDGKQPTEAMMNLAGLLRVEYVFAYPEENDIILAGPADGWMLSPAGHNVGVNSGLPVLQLQDLATALTVYAEGRPLNQWFGCSIGPSRGAMQKLQEFNRTIPRSIPRGSEELVASEILSGTLKSLGMAGVVTFGISSKTHMARRMIEADYRMKMIGIGVEAPPVRMKTFYNQIKAPPKSVLQRWWLVPNYERIAVSKDELSAHLVGAGIKLLTENYDRGKNGTLVQSKRKPSAASTAYSTDFTKNFEKIAQLSSCFGQLRNSVDLLVATVFIRTKGLIKKTKLDPGLILDDRIEYTDLQPITNAPCLINSKWKGRRFFTLAGGGVSITPSDALKEENLLKHAEADFAKARPLKLQEEWWWESK